MGAEAEETLGAGWLIGVIVEIYSEICAKRHSAQTSVQPFGLHNFSLVFNK